MYAIFYDLETSDRNPIGQILNYSFILVDDDLNPVDELSGLVRISRLQLPEAGAILANRTDVIEHQKIAKDFERDAMRRIDQFLVRCIEKAKGAVAFIGYNSSRFDLPFLRTSLVRNGYNPYYKQKLTPRDLLQVVQRAYLSSEKFRNLIREARTGEKKLSLSLETVTRALQLLKGAQVHESREDVLLTIELARWLKRECGIDAATFEAYEGLKVHSTAGSGAVYTVEEPEYDMASGNVSTKTPYALLVCDHKRALWINLERYSVKQDPSCIEWRSAQKHAFFLGPQASADRELQSLARAAIKQFKGITLANFFQRSTCDVEQDIYRVDFQALDLLCAAIRDNDREKLAELRTPEAKVLFTRYRLASPELNLADPATREVFKRYVLYRYGGELQVAKNRDEERQEGNHHVTLGEMVRGLELNKEAAMIERRTEDLKLLESLESFYKKSEILQVAGQELVPAWFRSAA